MRWSGGDSGTWLVESRMTCSSWAPVTAPQTGKVELGERSEELLRHLECPLALAPKGMAEREGKRLERIGVGFDDEAESRAALQLAGSIAVTAGADLEVRGIVDRRGPGGVTTE
jgi:hypothetical protein